MVRDAYANYVVQTTLDVIPECEEKKLLLEELNAHSTELVSLRSCILESIPDVSLEECFDLNSVYSSEKLHICKAYCYKIGRLMRSARA